MTNKICTTCGIEKTTVEFSKHKLHKDGLNSQCKPCVKIANAIWREKHGEYRKLRYQQEKISGKLAESRARSKDRIYIQQHKAHLRLKYNITQEDYNALYAQQQGQCAICKDYHAALVIDHDHSAKRVRGLLCKHCNWLLGHARDSEPILTSAVNYLEQHNGK